MTDKELLELAAKAAGITIKYNYLGTQDARCPWNPLDDDGDAFRLMIDLQLGVSVPPVVDGRIDVVTFYGPIISVIEYPKNDNRHAATRRAIVRAAAAIGKQMKEEGT